jgi:hypothetical protein
VRLNVSLACGLAAFLIAGFFAVRNLATWPVRLTYPGEESNEGIALAEIIHLRHGVPIYAPATDRYDDATYGPLYYLVAGRLIDIDAPSYFPLRLVSVLGIVGCAMGCGLLSFWLSDSYLAALLSPFVFLSYGMVTTHGIQALSDGVALSLAFSGFLAAYRLQGSRGVLLAVPLMILSFYYKPQYVAGFVAIFFYLLWSKRYRLAIEFASLWALCGLVLLSVFEWIVFPGQSFWRHFLFTQPSLLSWAGFEKAVFVLCFMLFLPLLFSLEYLHHHSSRMIHCYLFSSVLLGVLTYSKDGSGVHYFFESVLLLSALIPVLIMIQVRSHGCPAHLVLVLGIMLFAGQWSTKAAPQPSDFAHHDAMQQFLRQHFPRHAEGLSANPGELLQAGLETPYSGLFTLVQLSHRGVVSDRDLAAQIRARRFSVIVLGFDLSRESDPYWLNFYLTPATREAIEQGYACAESLEMPTPEKERPLDRYYIYVPQRNKQKLETCGITF